MTKRKIFDMGKNYDAIEAGTPVIVPVKYVSLEELRSFFPPRDVPLTPEWPGVEIKVSSEPFITDPAVRQKRITDVISLINSYAPIQSIQSELNARRSEALKAMMLYGGERWGDVYKPPTRWDDFKWRVSAYFCRIRDAWLVMIGKREVE
jgi:hypothetical protein